MCISHVYCRLIQPAFPFSAFNLCIKWNGRFLCEFSLILLDCLFFRQRGTLGCESGTCFKVKASYLLVEEISTVIYAKQILLLYLWGKIYCTGYWRMCTQKIYAPFLLIWTFAETQFFIKQHYALFCLAQESSLWSFFLSFFLLGNIKIAVILLCSLQWRWEYGPSLFFLSEMIIYYFHQKTPTLLCSKKKGELITYSRRMHFL